MNDIDISVKWFDNAKNEGFRIVLIWMFFFIMLQYELFDYFHFVIISLASIYSISANVIFPHLMYSNAKIIFSVDSVEFKYNGNSELLEYKDIKSVDYEESLIFFGKKKVVISKVSGGEIVVDNKVGNFSVVSGEFCKFLNGKILAV